MDVEGRGLRKGGRTTGREDGLSDSRLGVGKVGWVEERFRLDWVVREAVMWRCGL